MSLLLLYSQKSNRRLAVSSRLVAASHAYDLAAITTMPSTIGVTTPTSLNVQGAANVGLFANSALRLRQHGRATFPLASSTRLAFRKGAAQLVHLAITSASSIAVRRRLGHRASIVTATALGARRRGGIHASLASVSSTRLRRSGRAKNAIASSTQVGARRGFAKRLTLAVHSAIAYGAVHTILARIAAITHVVSGHAHLGRIMRLGATSALRARQHLAARLRIAPQTGLVARAAMRAKILLSVHAATHRGARTSTQPLRIVASTHVGFSGFHSLRSRVMAATSLSTSIAGARFASVTVRPFANALAALSSTAAFGVGTAVMGAAHGQLRSRIAVASTFALNVYRPIRSFSMTLAIGVGSALQSVHASTRTARLTSSTTIARRTRVASFLRLTTASMLAVSRSGAIRKHLAAASTVKRSATALDLAGKALLVPVAVVASRSGAITKHAVVHSALQMRRAAHAAALLGAFTSTAVGNVRRAYVRTYRTATHSSLTIAKQAAVAAHASSVTASKARTATHAQFAVLVQSALVRRAKIVARSVIASAVGMALAELLIPEASLLNRPTVVLQARFDEGIDPQ